MPACCHGTADIAVELSDAMASPAPTPTSTTPVRAIGAFVSAAPHAPRMSAWVGAAAATVKDAMPGGSMRLGLGSLDSPMTRRVIATATTLTGRLTRKIHRQPKLAVS